MTKVPREFIEERNSALVRQDMAWLRERFTGASDEVLEMALHKTRYEIPEIPRELRHASGHWLRERGLHRFDGSGLLPEGELP